MFWKMLLFWKSSPGLHSCPTARRSGKKKPLEAALVLTVSDPDPFFCIDTSGNLMVIAVMVINGD